MIRIITTRTAQSKKEPKIPEIPKEFEEQFNDMDEVPLGPPVNDDEGVVLQNDTVPMADDDGDAIDAPDGLVPDQQPDRQELTEEVKDLQGEQALLERLDDEEPVEPAPETTPELEPEPSPDLSIPDPEEQDSGVDQEQLQEIEVPEVPLDKLNALPPKNQIDMVMAINMQRELGDTPMPPLYMEIDYLTLPHRSSGARRFIPKRAIKPEETRVFGTGRDIMTAWDFTKNDYRRFAVSQIQRSEIKEQ